MRSPVLTKSLITQMHKILNALINKFILMNAIHINLRFTESRAVSLLLVVTNIKAIEDKGCEREL